MESKCKPTVLIRVNYNKSVNHTLAKILGAKNNSFLWINLNINVEDFKQMFLIILCPNLVFWPIKRNKKRRLFMCLDIFTPVVAFLELTCIEFLAILLWDWFCAHFQEMFFFLFFDEFCSFRLSWQYYSIRIFKKNSIIQVSNFL